MSHSKLSDAPGSIHHILAELMPNPSFSTATDDPKAATKTLEQCPSTRIMPATYGEHLDSGMELAVTLAGDRAGRMKKTKSLSKGSLGAVYQSSERLSVRSSGVQTFGSQTTTIHVLSNHRCLPAAYTGRAVRRSLKSSCIIQIHEQAPRKRPVVRRLLSTIGWPYILRKVLTLLDRGLLALLGTRLSGSKFRIAIQFFV